MMKKVSLEELLECMKRRDAGEKVELNDCLIDSLDLSGMDLHGISFDRSDFRNVNLNEANMSSCTALNAFFGGSSLHKANLSNADLTSADFRGCDLSEADICGAEMHCSALYRADLNGLITDDGTEVEVQAGDAVFTADGHKHGVKNIGNTELKMVAVIATMA